LATKDTPLGVLGSSCSGTTRSENRDGGLALDKAGIRRSAPDDELHERHLTQKFYPALTSQTRGACLLKQCRRRRRYGLGLCPVM
jgi:hypothetical protein